MRTNRLRGLRSRLPAGAAYWDALAKRILESAPPLLSQRTAWWDYPAWVSNSLLVGTVVGVVAAVALLPAPTNSAVLRAASVLERAIAPRDALAERVVVGSSPPSIADLLPEVLAEEGR